ncbi:MAG TPA: hypothetical protein VNB64_09690 [Solirubrobacteraceae bacterium]|nr:hypothetical protein [Solirubrobacteraceae bacterium]
MRILRCLFLAAAASLALPAASSASIVVGTGMIGGTLRTEMTATQLIGRAGPPSAVRTRTSEIFGAYREYRWGEVYVSAFRSNGAIFNFYTRGRSARTSSGIGVGSSENFLRSRLSGETCRTLGGFRDCIVGREEPGQIVTRFSISRTTARVTSVTVGRVID